MTIVILTNLNCIIILCMTPVYKVVFIVVQYKNK